MPPRQKTNYAAAANRAAPAPERTAPAEKIRTQPIRVTLDLSPTQHRDLKKWCNAAAADLDLSAVALAQVLRLLGDELVANKDLADRIRDRLRSAGE